MKKSWTHMHWLAAMAVLVLLSGCKVGPKYRKPSVTTPPAFRGSPAANDSDPHSIGDLQWFEVFKDEPLQELIRAALAQNYDLRIAMARVDAAHANLGIRRSDQYPTIGAGGRYCRGPTNGRRSGPSSGRTHPDGNHAGTHVRYYFS